MKRLRPVHSSAYGQQSDWTAAGRTRSAWRFWQVPAQPPTCRNPADPTALPLSAWGRPQPAASRPEPAPRAEDRSRALAQRWVCSPPSSRLNPPNTRHLPRYDQRTPSVTGANHACGRLPDRESRRLQKLPRSIICRPRCLRRAAPRDAASPRFETRGFPNHAEVDQRRERLVVERAKGSTRTAPIAVDLTRLPAHPS